MVFVCLIYGRVNLYLWYPWYYNRLNEGFRKVFGNRLVVMVKNEAKKTWKRDFILSLREHGIPAIAAEQVGVRIGRVALAKKDDPKFLEYFQEAIDLAKGHLEHEARKQAFAGSERLMIKMLEGNIPEKYSKTDQLATNVFVKAYVGFTPDLWDQDAVSGELAAQGLIAEQPSLTQEEVDPENISPIGLIRPTEIEVETQ